MKLAALLTLPFVLLGGLLASMSWVVVDVRQSADGVRLIVPVPLLAAQTALAFVPAVQKRVDLPEDARRALPAAEKAIHALKAAPDGELVRVEDRDQRVLITKEGDLLRIRVHDADGDQDVKVDVPLDLADRILSESQDGVSASEVVAALRDVSHTDLVEVRDGRDHVKVWIW